IPYGRETSGRNIAGILKASQGIFDVDPDELNIAQAAYLAGLPQNPYTYTPFTNEGEIKNNEGLQPGLDRMEVVLNRMHSAEVITKKSMMKQLIMISQKISQKMKHLLERNILCLFLKLKKERKKFQWKKKLVKTILV